MAVPFLAVFRVQLSIPENRVFQPFFLREAQHLLDLGTDVKFGHGVVEWGDECDGWNILDQGPELEFRHFSLADVANHAGRQRAPIALHGT